MRTRHIVSTQSMECQILGQKYLGSVWAAFNRAFSHGYDWESQEEVAKDNTQSGAIARRYQVRCSKGWRVLRKIFKELER